MAFHTCVQQVLRAGGAKSRSEVDNLQSGFVTWMEPPLISRVGGCSYPEYPFLFFNKDKTVRGMICSRFTLKVKHKED